MTARKFLVLLAGRRRCSPPTPPSEEEWEESAPVWASDAEEAASSVAESWDVGDYSLLDGNSVWVYTQSREGLVQLWFCHGEAEPTYYADETLLPGEEEE